MRTNIHILFVAAMLVLASCGNKNDIESKKAKLEDLKKQQGELKVNIETLEKEISTALAASGKTEADNTKYKLISVTTVTPAPFKHYIEIQGKIDSDKNVLISAKASGTITKIYVNKGDQVRAGSILATIEDAAISRGVEELETNLRLVTTIYEKQKSLWDQKIGTEIQYLQAKANKEALEKRLAQTKEQQDFTKIRATIDGTVDEIYPNEGEVTTMGAPAFRIINTSNLKIVADIAEAYTGRVKKGDKVILYFPDLEETRESVITNVGDIINEVNRTFKIEAKLVGNSKSLKANMIVYVKILDYVTSSSIVIPINPVQHSEEGDFVFLFENGKAKKTPIKIGKTYQNSAEVVSGLKEGDKLVTLGYQDIVNGQPIKF